MTPKTSVPTVSTVSPPSRPSAAPASRFKTLALGLLLVALAAGGWWTLKHSERPAAAAAPETVASPAVEGDTVRFADKAPQLSMLKILPVKLAAAPLTEPLSARLVYDEDVTVRIGTSFSGRIVALKAAAGDRVRAGQTLAEIDSPDFGSASADLDKARADLEQKQRALTRSKELLQAEVIARKDYEQAADDEAQARAEARRAQLRVSNLLPTGATVKGERLPLTSPIGGLVTERTANPGMEVNPALPAPLFVVTDPRKLWLLIDLPEHLLSKVQVGASVDLQVEAWPGETFSARVIQLGQVIDPSTRRIPVRAEVNNADLKLRAEMFARATLQRPSAVAGGQAASEAGGGAMNPMGAGAVEVPNTALINDGLYTAVFLETAPNTFSKRRVEVAVRGADKSFLTGALKDGDRLVTQGALLLSAVMRSGADDAAPAAQAASGAAK